MTVTQWPVGGKSSATDSDVETVFTFLDVNMRLICNMKSRPNIHISSPAQFFDFESSNVGGISLECNLILLILKKKHLA